MDIVGGHGSGRSTFLNALRLRLEDKDWTVVTIRGVASLRQHPLGALHLAGIGGENRKLGNLQETGAALQQILKGKRAVLFLDDWDDLDESSWGVTESTRRATGVPVVLTRLQGLRARHTPSGLRASTIESSQVIDMTPLRFEDMERALVDHLNAPIESSTLSHIYGKTGGNIGLAVNLVDATIRDGQLGPRRGKLVALKDLWSSSLRGVLEGYLEDLDDNTRDALEIIAITGSATLSTVRKLVDWETLELLEQRALVTFIQNGQSHLVTVIPPMLVEFFRHEPLNARRVRLTELIRERLGKIASDESIVLDRPFSHEPASERDAVFVGLLHERERALRIVTATEWESAPVPSNAIRYIEALSQTMTPATKAVANRVFAETDRTAEGAFERAMFASLQARWLAYADQDLEAALQCSAKYREELGVFGRILDAAEIEIEYSLGRLPDDFSERLEVTEDLPESVKIKLLQVQLFVLCGTARFDDAQRVYAELETLTTPSNPARMLNGLSFLGKGDFTAALELFTHGLDEATSYLEVEGVRLFGSGVMITRVYTGDTIGLDGLVESVLAAGHPTPFPAGNQLALLSVGALSAIRSGHIATGEQRIADIELLTSADGPLPGQSRSWAHAQLLVFNGQPVEAADLLWSAAENLWERRALFAALSGFLTAVELDPTNERIREARSYLAQVEGTLVFDSQLQYYEAFLAVDLTGMLEAAEVFLSSGRLGTAIRAFQHVSNVAREDGNSDVAKAASDKLMELRELYGHERFDVARIAAGAVSLTEREREVARLAAVGRSNQEIATRLVLSIRTVETHMHRIMQKLDVNSRQEIRANLVDVL
ncbi:helix-turn-helix transcriptional regulator [Leucobacter viscericola]|uniref:Helix-turn-helix transcriptional regulator n=1 Tax=Leucobacter viscericola TaxID=2714935 RepID=A0A6G7XG24_9MICO|nr:LuxR C-terminal-related transcriptional regulator [Leucobacter viscericola]QIK63347.1 helix-turn-helix transcriptional regulator [Leucobacter viscericola]